MRNDRLPARWTLLLCWLLTASLALGGCTPAPPPPGDGTWTREPSRVPDTPAAPTGVPEPPLLSTPTPARPPTPIPHAELLENEHGEAHIYAGVARVQIGDPCTGVLIQTRADAADAPAYVLTSGRCAGAYGANDVVIDGPVAGARVVFNYFEDTPAQRLEVPVRRVAYATSKGSDVAVVELAVDLRALDLRGIAAWPVADRAPGTGAVVSITGAPVERFAGSEAFLRRSVCTLEARVDVLEGPWHWYGAYRDTCLDVTGGSAGAPAIDGRDGRVVALVAATEVRAETSACEYHQACEVDRQGLRAVGGANYLVDVAGLARCFDERGAFALAQAGCPLDDGRQVRIDGYPTHAVRPVVTGADGSEQARPWDLALGSEAYSTYRYKAGPAASTDCRAPEGYGVPAAIGASTTITAPVPTVEGHYVLCVLGGAGPGPGDGWQDPSRATVVHLAIDTTPPRGGPGVLLEADEHGYRIFLTGEPPEIAAFGVKMGPAGTVDCGAPGGYTRLAGDWFALPHPAETVQLCIVAYDEAGNASEPIALPLSE